MAKGKKKTAVKSMGKKVSGKKSAGKTASKAAGKATMKKSAAKAAPKKAASKKSATKKSVAAKATVKKAAPKVASKKATSTKAAGSNAPKASSSKEKLDLSNFITPLDDRLIVLPEEREKMTAGGLYIPDTAADQGTNVKGLVVSVGRGHRSAKGHLRPMDVQVGDQVLFAQHSGSQFKVQNHDLLILREADVLGVVG